MRKITSDERVKVMINQWLKSHDKKIIKSRKNYQGELVENLETFRKDETFNLHIK